MTDLKNAIYRYWRIFTIMEFYSRGFKKNLFFLLFFSTLLGVTETFQILLLYPILNASFNVQEIGIPFLEPFFHLIRNSTDLPEVVIFCLLFISFVLVTFLITLICKTLSLLFTKSAIVNTKEMTFQKLERNDYRYFVDNKQGDVLYNVITSPQNIKNFFEYLTLMFSDIVVILIIIGTLFFISPVAILILLIIGFGFLFSIRYIGYRIAYMIGKVQMSSISNENVVITQYVSGIRQIRSVHADNYWRKQYFKVLHMYWDKYVRAKFTEALPASVLQMVFLLGIAIVVIVIYYLYTDRFLVIIPLIGTFAFSALKILPRLANMSSYFMVIMNAYSSLERMYNFLNNFQYNTIKSGSMTFNEFTTEISFQDVCFQYYDGQELIKNLSFTIKKNQVTALVGHSGSGKSTMVSLLLRYFDVTDGRILIDGIDLREYDTPSFLAKVGYVSQDTFIFNASVRDNIAFGSDYTDKQIIRAAEKANIDAFIKTLNHGYDTIVGDQGIKLSGGEKQRIAIARALVREPDILVLDEATSNLDNESEAIVQSSINQISKTITTFVIAHRLTTIRKADTIYVMSKGRIVESGGHDDLLKIKGKYWELYEKGV